MKISKNNLNQFYSEIILISIILLFFFQLISDFVDSVYALNLIEVELNENILSVLLLLTPVLLMFFKKKIPIIAVILIGELMVLMRVFAPLFSTQLKMIFSGTGLACFMIFWPSLIYLLSKKKSDKIALKMGSGLAISLILSIFFRTLGATIDISSYSYFQWIGWFLAIILGIMIFNMKTELVRYHANSPQEMNSNEGENSFERKTKPSRTLKILALSIGIIGVLNLIYFAFSSPTVISRWSGGNYALIITILAFSSTLFILIQHYKPTLLINLKKSHLILWNALFIIFLVLLIVINQVYFVFVVEYPIYVFPTSLFHNIILIIMLLLFPIILIDFTFLSKGILMGKPSPRKIGGSFTIAAIFMLVLIFSNVFTIAWDYIPLIGNLFRDMVWFVYLILGLSIILPISILRQKNLIKSPRLMIGKKFKLTISFIVIFCCISSICASILMEVSFTQSLSSLGSLNILSYNIQQGYDEFGNKNYEGQYQVIRTLAPDIIGLQESDTSRISGGNSDIVRYINQRLHYYSYFGPKTVTGTFGIALLSKFPIKNAQTFYMESKGEQTATIEAQITIEATTFNIFVTHLGNYVNTSVDRSQIVQQENILQMVAGKSNVILMGDFNFRPFTEQYNITLDLLDDAWVSASSATVGIVPLNWQLRLPNKRIDHIFVSPDLNTSINEVRYTGGGAADHPALFMKLDLT